LDTEFDTTQIQDQPKIIAAKNTAPTKGESTIWRRKSASFDGPREASPILTLGLARMSTLRLEPRTRRHLKLKSHGNLYLPHFAKIGTICT
jgi:hypothetical protein